MARDVRLSWGRGPEKGAGWVKVTFLAHRPDHGDMGEFIEKRIAQATPEVGLDGAQGR